MSFGYTIAPCARLYSQLRFKRVPNLIANIGNGSAVMSCFSTTRSFQSCSFAGSHCLQSVTLRCARNIPQPWHGLPR